MSASEQIDKMIADVSDWRADVLTKLRKLIKEVEPQVTEEWKWETPVWEYNGILCAVGLFKDHVKINFFNGAALADPHKLFNAGLEAKKTRAIDFSETTLLDEKAVKDMIQSAVDYNKKNSTILKK